MHGRSVLCLLFAVAAAVAVTACGSRTQLEVPAGDAGAPEVAVTACGPGTCAGCCDETGACRPGTEQSACGIGGSACQACDPRFDVCNPQGGGGSVPGNACWAPCPVRECGGCCTLDGACVAGTADDACGGPQRVCDDCTSRGLVCGAVDEARGCVGR